MALAIPPEKVLEEMDVTSELSALIPVLEQLVKTQLVISSTVESKAVIPWFVEEKVEF